MTDYECQLEKLRPKAIRLRELGFTYQEIADAMELSVQAVKSLLSRARVNLKTLLEPYVTGNNLPDAKTDAKTEASPDMSPPNVVPPNPSPEEES